MIPPEQFEELAQKNTEGHPHLEKIEQDKSQGDHRNKDISTSFLLQNLHDSNVLAMRINLNSKQVDGWSVEETTHRATENNSIKSSISNLKQRYCDHIKPTISDINNTIYQNKQQLMQEGMTEQDYYYLLAQIEKIFTQNNQWVLLQLCWVALHDQNMPCKECFLGGMPVNEMTRTRVHLFLKELVRKIREKKICSHGEHNAIYEAMQCLHPDTRPIMDLAAIPDLIMLKVQEALLEYLKQHVELAEQLQIIKQWLTNTENGLSIFGTDQAVTEQKIINSVFMKLKEKGYKDNSEKIVEKIKKHFSATPLFLREFENLDSEFHDTIYVVYPKINSLEDHIKYFCRMSIAKKFNWLSELCSDDDSYQALIDKLVNQRIAWDNERISESNFILLFDHFKTDETLLNRFLQKIIDHPKQTKEVKLLALMHFFTNKVSNKRTAEDIITDMSHIGTAEEVMWLLCYLYAKAQRKSERMALQKLIILLYKQGVKSEKCIQNNISAAQLIMSTEFDRGSTVYQIIPNKYFKNFDLNKYCHFRESFVLIATIPLCMVLGLPLGIILAGAFGVISMLAFALIPVIFHKELFGFCKSFVLRTKLSKKIDDPEFACPDVTKSQFKNFFVPKTDRTYLKEMFSPFAKISKIFESTAFPYNSNLDDQTFVKDILQPLDGVKHIIKGLVKILTSPFIPFKKEWRPLDIATRVVSGLSTMALGVAELALTPYTYLIKIPCRVYQTIEKKSALQGDLMIKATQLQDEILSSSTIKQYRQSSSISDNDFSLKQLNNNLFNKAVSLHNRYKQFKLNVPLVDSQFKRDEKERWQNVKTTFFARIVNQKPAINYTELKVLNDYVSLYTNQYHNRL